MKSQDRGSSSALNAGQVTTGSVSGQTQLVLPSELLQLTKENRVTLEEVRELTTRAFAAFGAMSQVESLRELDGLVKMAKHLEKVVVSRSNHCRASKHVSILTINQMFISVFLDSEIVKERFVF